MCALSVGLVLLNASATGASSQSTAATANSSPEKVNMEHALFAPRPEYPYLASKERIAGSGIAVMKIDPKTGRVVRAFMAISTGASILDEATLSAVRQWRFKPGTVRFVKVPISYTVMGGYSVGYRGYERHSKSMDDVLASYLGKGTVLNGPIPEYPTGIRGESREGRGVYELHAGKSGHVENVKVLKSSGDPLFDTAAQKTLGKWRLSRGPLTLELPLQFVLTPESYRVNVTR